ncbi:MAG TPA: undecaprenyl-diphosphate phosphatase [Acidimicrobiales bacterium]|nr:undecaprenyl-diphosphate phosphatase [Acidimicrobiales bacterium]
MSIFHAIVLGITQGLSEYLPISSSGHLILVPWLFGWDDFAGNDHLKKAFDVALHMGTLAGALAYFRADVMRYSRASLRMIGHRDRSTVDGRIGWMLLLSAVPAALVGALLDSKIETLDDKIWLIAVMLIALGLLLLIADRLTGKRQVYEFRVRDAVIMGTAQMIALQPGSSRSGLTITAGRWLGFDRDSAARLSFLMALPIIAGAGVYKLADVIANGGIPSELRGAFVAGMITSGITGWFAVWGMLRFVRTRTFTPFVVYRVAAGIGVLILLSTSFR